jgi:LysR family glycine cleavage system transcriptional activator
MVETQPFPSLASIRAFESAARLGSFSKAAAELGTAAAAVSYHVRQLERQIGVTLFERHPQSVSLTAAGAEIASESSRFFSSLRATFVRAAETQNRRLSITALPTLGTSWLTPRLGEFRSHHPEIEIELDLSQKAHELGAGRFDAAIRHGDGNWPGLRSVRLFPCLFMPLCAPHLKAAAVALPDPRRSLPVPLLGRIDWWQRWYAEAGWPNIDLSRKLGTRLAAEHLDASAAIAGHGVTIGSPILFSDEIRAGRLVAANHLIAGDGRHFWFVYPVLRGRSQKIEVFRDWLVEEANKARADLRELQKPRVSP